MILESPQADAQSQKAAKVGELPELPINPAVYDLGRFGVAYSADQMHAYARAAIAALQTSHSDSAPKWSPTPPTKDGWYWTKGGLAGPQVVEIYGGAAYSASGDNFKASKSGNLWHGPLQEPAE